MYQLSKLAVLVLDGFDHIVVLVTHTKQSDLSSKRRDALLVQVVEMNLSNQTTHTSFKLQ
jgi:hypothetical protein